ncbi:muconolactone delta-isomerase [Nocardia brasiliensis]|nr:muconolactone delta-isomerase [Nocardia brasiliensis]
MPAEERDRVIERERARGRELQTEGVLRDIWRVPGRRANIGIWSAADADALEATLTSLPIWPYAEFDVSPLATHQLSRSV